MKICKKGIHIYEPNKKRRGCIQCQNIHNRQRDKIRYKNPLRRLQIKIAQLKHYRTVRKPYTQYKKDKCEIYGFILINQIQLDVDHIDGNHDNNEPSNLKTLYANCHRLKTYENNESAPK